MFFLISTLALVGQAPRPLAQSGDALPEQAVAGMNALRLRHEDAVRGVCFAHDQKTLFSAGEDNAVRQWDVATGKLLREWPGHDRNFRFIVLALSPDGKILAAAGWSSARSCVYLWDVASGNRLDALDGKSSINGLAFSHDSKTLAWIEENRLVFWERAVKSKRTIRIPSFLSSTCLAYSPDSKQVAVGDEAGIRLIDAETGNSIRFWKHEGEFPAVHCVRYSRDGTMLATAGFFAPIHIWDAKTGKRLQTFNADGQLNFSIGLAPDGKTLVSQCGCDILFWDIATGKQRKSITFSERDYACDFAFSRDGKMLAIAHANNTISLLDSKSGKLLFP